MKERDGLRKLVIFDLSTKQLQSHYPKADWRGAYKDIKKHMKDNGFEWQEGSSYISKEVMSWITITDVLSSMASTQPWLKYAMRDCVVADIDVLYNQTHIFKSDGVDMTKVESIKKQIEDEDEI